jgi:membrane-associated phospholipid phosphatase
MDLISISFSGIQAPSLLWRGLGLFQTKLVFGQDLFRQSGHTKLYIVLWIKSSCMTVGVGWNTFFVILPFLVGVSEGPLFLIHDIVHDIASFVELVYNSDVMIP